MRTWIVAFPFLAACGPGSSEATLTSLACMEAQDVVKGRLRAPASAKFPSCALGITEYEIRATPSKDKIWVFGHVDSQNSFGAMIRSEFAVTFRTNQRLDAPSQWTTEGVAIE